MTRIRAGCSVVADFWGWGFNMGVMVRKMFGEISIYPFFGPAQPCNMFTHEGDGYWWLETLGM